MEKERCSWCLKDDLYINYHDLEWGVPVADDETMFEFLILETFQAGLSWYTVLRKRENFRKAFFNFDAEKMAQIKEDYFEKLLENTAIIRNKAKIKGAIDNAKQFLRIRDSGMSFCDFMWKFTDGKIITNRLVSLSEIQSTSKESDRMSKELKQLGFKFVGSTVCYAHMQATGMVNDHVTGCFRFAELNSLVN